MNLVFIAAFVAACSAATLDRTYLPPSSSQSAGGNPGIFSSFNTKGVNALNPGLQAPFQRTSDNNPSRGISVPSGSYENDHEGVVVDAAAPGTRAVNQPSGLGGPRVNYGSTDSKVGEAAFRGIKKQPAATTYENNKFNAFQSQSPFGTYQHQGPANVEPDLSAFYQPTGQKPISSFTPEIKVPNDLGPTTLKYYNNFGLNKYDYGYETENGIISAERGVSNNGVMSQGSYSYKGDDGKVYSIVYTADKDGFRPTGSHLPTPPPIPAEIMESLQQNAKDEANGIYDDGSYDAQKYNAQDDYAQSDANSNYNDRQSNKFGGRPGYGAGGSTFINQAQQGFVRPNAQGQFSSYDFSNSKDSLTQPDTSEFETGVNRFGNTKQSNTFLNRPGFNAGANLFYNQGQQGFVRPNAQGQFSSYDFSKHKDSLTQPDTSEFETGVNRFDNTKQSNTFLSRPGFNTAISSFNNQGQQGYVRPNAQGQFSSYDFQNSKDSSTQPDTSKFGIGVSDFDNTKQSNKFGERLGSNAGGNSFINQGPLSVVRPNAQGQFSSYDSTKDLSLKKPDSPKLSADDSGFDITKQSNTFGMRPGSDATFMNHKQGFVLPNIQGQTISYDFSKDSSSTQPDISKFGTGVNVFVNTSNLGNRLTQNGQNTQVNNKFGSQFQYLPPLGNDHDSTDSSKNTAQLLSEQKLQDQEFLEKPFTTQIKPSSFEQTMSTQVPTNNPLTPFSPSSNSLGIINGAQNDALFQNGIQSSISSDLNDHNSPIVYSNGSLSISDPSQTIINNSSNTQGPFFQTGIQSSLIGSDLGLEISGITQSSPVTNDNGFLSLPTPVLNIGVASSQEIVNSPQNQGSSFQTGLQSSGDIKNEKPKLDFSNKFSSSVSLETLPTRKPEITLTTPLENQEQQTNSVFSELGTSFVNSQPQMPSSNNIGNSQSFSLNNQNPNNGQISTTFLGQAQVPDDSYIYNKPSNPFLMPSAQPDFNKTPGLLSSQFNSVTQPSGPSFPNGPEGSIFSTQKEGLTGSTKYPQAPTLAPITPTLATSDENETGKNTFQTNGITQASISSFPSITPTSSQTYSGEVYEYTKPAQGLPEENTRESTNSGMVKPILLPSSQKEGPIKPQISANTQFGQQFSTPSASSFGQQTTPLIFSAQTGSLLGQNPTAQPQSGAQETSSFGQKPTLSSFDAQTGLPFGQHPIQQLGAQSSFSFGQKTTQSRFEALTSTSLNQQTSPTRFGDQTSSSFNRKPTLSPFGAQSSTLGQQPTQSQLGGQSSVPFGSQTTPSRFGDQTSLSFGQKLNQQQSSGQTDFSIGSQTTRFGAQTSSSFNSQTTPSAFSIPSRFDVQASSTFGQKPIQSQPVGQTSVSFGSQTTASQFGVPTSTSFGQQTTSSRLGIQSSLSTAQEKTPPPFPSRFGVQASSPFEPKPTQSQLGGQSSVSFGSQTTPSPFAASNGPSIGQQTTTSRFGIQSSLSTAQQTTSSPLSGQTDTLFGQQTTPSRFGVHTSSFTSQQTATLPAFSEQTSSAFGQKITPSRFEDSLSEQQSAPQFENKQQQNENGAELEKQSQSQESNEQSETQSDSKPSSNSDESIEINNADEIYQYNKPTTSFPTNGGSNTQLNSGLQQSQANNQLGQQSIGLNKKNGATLGQLFDDNKSLQFGIKPNNQFGLQTESTSSGNKFALSQQSQGAQLNPIPINEEESFSTPTQNDGASQPNQQYQETVPPSFPQQQKVTSLPFPSITTTQPVAPASSSEQNFDSKESTAFQFSSISPDNTQMSSQNAQSSFNLQKQDQSQNSQSGEVYQYDKPSQSLLEPSQVENNRFGQKQESIQQPGQNKLDITKPITSHLSQSNENLNNVQLPTQSSDALQSQTDNKIQSGSSQSSLPSSKPELSFYSACCRGFKMQGSQGLQSFSGKAPADTRLNANFESNSFGFHKNDNHVSNASDLKDNKFGNIESGSGIQDFGAQKETPTFIGNGEEFGGPRNPPKFDETGYHY